MAIYLTGDTHGMLDIGRLTERFELDDKLTKQDYLIILGDAGILWNQVDDEDVHRILEKLPVTTLWIDGNHENFDLLEKYPESYWNGGRVHRISESIIHLCRGQVFEIDGRTFFTFGGGNSIDKFWRLPSVSWWPQEMPTNFEYEEGISNLEQNNWQVDYVLTHTCPTFVARQLVTSMHPGEEPLQEYLNHVAERLAFKEWFFGHWHMDTKVEKFRCLYRDIVELT